MEPVIEEAADDVRPRVALLRRLREARISPAAAGARRVALVAYALVAVASAFFTLIVTSQSGPRLEGLLTFCVPLIAYGALLSVAAARIRRGWAPPGAFAGGMFLVAAHAVTGAIASVAMLLMAAFPPSLVLAYAVVPGIIGVVVGWLPGLLLTMVGAEAGGMLATGFVGTVWLVLRFATLF